MKFSVEEQKAEFVGRELTALLRRIDKEIDHAVYEKFNNGEEYVEVHYRQYLFRPESSPRPIVVCVTADSLSALTSDVLKAIESRRERIRRIFTTTYTEKRKSVSYVAA